MDKNKPAILGGTPIFERPHHLVRPILPPISEVVEGLETLYETRMFTNQGAFVRTLEERIAEKLNVRHCALFCNCTIAMMCLFQTLGLRGKVLVPSFTFAATTQALLWQGITPQFVDIDRAGLTVCPEEVEKQITEETSAIFPVNVFGSCCNHDRLSDIARKHSLPLLYDSAQSFGTRYKGRPVGSLGDAEAFSFHATKIFHTGEGGCITTDDPDFYERLCKVRNFGFEGYLNCTGPGINGKMSEFSALIGLKLLDHLESHIRQRRWVFQHYQESLRHIPGIGLPPVHENIESNCSYFNVMIFPEKFGLNNVELNYALSAERIVTRCYFFPPVHRTRYYQSLFEGKIPELPNTDWAALHTLCLPVYSDMQASELGMIIEGLFRCHHHSEEIKAHLVDKVPWGVEALASQPFDDPYDRFIIRRGQQSESASQRAGRNTGNAGIS
jgi:dTDP-4-amino-4,6-dideoxygalactose transaminase